MKYIFTPGPVKMSKDILKIGSTQVPYFRNEKFSNILIECEEMLLDIVNAPKESRVLFITASGTAGMEASIYNLVDKNDKVLIINGGVFGQRFVDICDLYELNYIEYKVDKDNNLSNTKDLEKFKNIDVLLINGHETSIGLLYDLKSIGDYCKKNNILNVVDGISMFVTDELDMQKFNIDLLIVSSNKGLALAPGLVMVILTKKAINKIKEVKSLYFNFKDYLKDGIRGQTPYTPAISIILQLHFRLQQIIKNGIENEIKKAKKVATYFRENIKNLPLKCYTKYMSNGMTPLMVTNQKSAYEIVKDLDEKYDIVVAPNGGELKDKIFRVSHMGDISIEYTDILIKALKDYYKS